MAAACSRSSPATPPDLFWKEALPVVTDRSLAQALHRAGELAAGSADALEAGETLGTTGFAPHTASFATFCFLRYGSDPLPAIVQSIRAGGDTDSIAAIVGAWAGALHGESGLPQNLLRLLHDGPFGPTHLRALAACLAETRHGSRVGVPGYSAPAALVRNLALYPVVLYHGFRRLMPF
jgi:hypothetical protein